MLVCSHSYFPLSVSKLMVPLTYSVKFSLVNQFLKQHTLEIAILGLRAKSLMRYYRCY